MNSRDQSPLSASGTVTRGGQITVPSRLRRALGIKPGDQLRLEVVKGELIARPAVRSGGPQITVNATRFRKQMFGLLDQLGEGTLDRVIVTHKKLPPIQIIYDGHLHDVDLVAEATSL